MRWRGKRRSINIEDQRGAPRARGRRGGIGLGAILLVLAVGWVLGVDPETLLQSVQQAGIATDSGLDFPDSPTSPPGSAGAPPDDQREFVSVVLADTEVTWQAAFEQAGRTYEEPTLVLFSGSVNSACGLAGSATGPFYCPVDQKVYIDLSFYDELQARLGAPGDFAQAYVIAHEVGHHVQNLMGVSGQIQRRRQRSSEVESNRLSVLLELQADCLAGVWAYNADNVRRLLEQGDVEEGLRAAAAIGDDRLQQQAGGSVVPDSFTHGSSAQRVKWFRTGLETGNVGECDTFSAE
ncbi:MAG: zinc metallopeptidase [Candidatus Binatia bacterium]|nr:zinc metallopeptidase [Candidatus Binatia bacterium]